MHPLLGNSFDNTFSSKYLIQVSPPRGARRDLPNVYPPGSGTNLQGGEIIPIFLIFALFLIWGEKPKKKEEKKDDMQLFRRITIEEPKK
ncbi:MAG: hypothetical protein ACRC8A_16200 [Microcoleaceae cyanobacterium]